MAEPEKTTNGTKNKCENMLQKKASMLSNPIARSQRRPFA
jgi:hypothetical protein